jgi:hypothetical protein
MKTLIKFELTAEEKLFLLRGNYGAETTSANRTIGRYIVAVCEEGISITEGRECFATQKMKDAVIERLSESKRVGIHTKRALGSNYTHYVIKCKIGFISFCRNAPYDIKSML